MRADPGRSGTAPVWKLAATVSPTSIRRSTTTPDTESGSPRSRGTGSGQRSFWRTRQPQWPRRFPRLHRLVSVLPRHARARTTDCAPRLLPAREPESSAAGTGEILARLAGGGRQDLRQSSPASTASRALTSAIAEIEDAVSLPFPGTLAPYRSTSAAGARRAVGPTSLGDVEAGQGLPRLAALLRRQRRSGRQTAVGRRGPTARAERNEGENGRKWALLV